MKKPVHDYEEYKNSHEACSGLESERRHLRREVIHQADGYTPRDQSADKCRSGTGSDWLTIYRAGAHHTGRTGGQNQNTFQPLTKYEHGDIEHCGS